MSKIVLLAVNSKYVHTALSVRVIAASLRENTHQKHEVEIVETTIHNPHEEIAETIASHNPDIIGISTYIWNATWLTGFLKLLKKRLPDTKLIMGGPEAEHNAEYWLKQGADQVANTGGRFSCVNSLTQENRPPVFGAAAQNMANSEFRIPNSELTKDPYQHDDPATLRGRILYLETSRGCPFDCAFCLSAGTGVSLFPLDSAKKQIEKLSGYGARTIKLVDRTFNINPERAYELFEHVIGIETAGTFHFEVAPDLFDERTIKMLRTAPPGRIQLEAGLQSFFEPALKASSRQTDLEKAERNIITLLQNGNIHIHIDLIAGLPNETLYDFKKSFDRAYALCAHVLQLGFLKLLHGSALRRDADSLGIKYSQEPPYEIQSSPWLTPGDLLVLKQTENALQHTKNKSRFLTAIEYVLETSGMSPFDLFHGIGESCPSHATDLQDYAGQVFRHCITIPGIDENELRDRMIFDWLRMVKGKNMPEFLRDQTNRRAQIIKTAQERLGRTLRRDEAAVLSSGAGLYIDSESRDPVTGLYKIFIE